MNHVVRQDFSLFCCICFAAIEALLLKHTLMFGVHHSVNSDSPPKPSPHLPTWWLVVYFCSSLSNRDLKKQSQATVVCRLRPSLVLINRYSNQGCLGGLSHESRFSICMLCLYLLSAHVHISNDAFHWIPWFFRLATVCFWLHCVFLARIIITLWLDLPHTRVYVTLITEMNHFNGGQNIIILLDP